MSVALDPSIPAPAPVGAMITWSAAVSQASPGTLWYRFRERSASSGASQYPPRARLAGTGFRMVRDYGPLSTLDWTASEHEGAYEIEVSVKNENTGETATAFAIYQMTSRVSGGAPAISPTANPLVFLYSAPACPVGSQMRVQFQSPDGVAQSTPNKACLAGLSMNFYLAGMRPNTPYSVRHIVLTGSQSAAGPMLTVTTPGVPLSLAAYNVIKPPPVASGILLQSTLFEGTIATDLSGNLVWFYQGDLTNLTRPQAGGYFLGVYENPTVDPSHEIVREFDLVGRTIAETNAARVSQQLVAMGMHPINAFHHEARMTPDGKILVLANSERMLTDVQGPGAVDVLGDTILVLDSNLQVAWAWDAFDHLDPHRSAVLGEVCTPVGAGCAPFYQAPQANDWLHGNSLQLTPDGSILYSSRHQDWLIKIDYSNGQGSGNVIWRLGKDGDFQFNSSDPYPWFSHQHDANFVSDSDTALAVFDDGNTRQAIDASANSRGQVLQLDEPNRVATLALNADLGAYSYALGSAQKLPNGNYHFDVGFIQGNPAMSHSMEVDPSGSIVYDVQVATPEYRTFRMADLYTP
ncbi:MAG TPA: aryl-sulfate sulfotransferase [Bryobacterales bacterium]|nr:aryl-sulfate sulfotransferase [Bryobacterales bacterium]